MLPKFQSFLATGIDDVLYTAGRGGADVYKSVDSGNSWQFVLDRAPTSTNGIHGLHVTSEGYIILLSQEMRISFDGGDTFTPANTGIGLSTLGTFYSTPDGRIFGGGDGLYEATISPITNSVGFPIV